MIECIGAEVVFGEAPLRQQRAEHVNRLIAALHALDHIDPRQPGTLRLTDPHARLRFGLERRARRRVGGTCLVDRVGQRQPVLCRGGRRKRRESDDEKAEAHLNTPALLRQQGEQPGAHERQRPDEVDVHPRRAQNADAELLEHQHRKHGRDEHVAERVCARR